MTALGAAPRPPARGCRRRCRSATRRPSSSRRSISKRSELAGAGPAAAVEPARRGRRADAARSTSASSRRSTRARRSAALRIEAGRLCERLGDPDRARAHYDAALLADPRATAALRGLRRIARASGDLIEATRQLDAELAVAGALERRPLGHYRIDLLLASGEQDLARVAVGEILDSAPSDVRALLAQLELAFLDGRADEFGARARAARARGQRSPSCAPRCSPRVACSRRTTTTPPAPRRWFAAAAESDPASLGARLGAIRQAAAAGRRRSRRARAARSRAPGRADRSDRPPPRSRCARSTGPQARPPLPPAQLATRRRRRDDPLVARIAAETASTADDPAPRRTRSRRGRTNRGAAAERAYAAARAAELDPARGAELWRAAITHDPGDDYAAAQLRTAHVAAEATQLSIDVDLEVAADPSASAHGCAPRSADRRRASSTPRSRSRSRARAIAPSSLALTEALGEALAAAGKWSERAKLFAELAADPGDQLDREVAQLRSALAWEEAVGAAAAEPSRPDSRGAPAHDRRRARRVGAACSSSARGNSPAAHAAAIVLANRLGDRDVIGEVLLARAGRRALAVAAASLALAPRRAGRATIRSARRDDPARARQPASTIRAAPSR